MEAVPRATWMSFLTNVAMSPLEVDDVETRKRSPGFEVRVLCVAAVVARSMALVPLMAAILVADSIVALP
jgi:hypothetical protein